MTVIAAPSVNYARSTLASSFTRGTDTTIVLADGTLFPSPTPKGHVAFIHETDAVDSKYCLVIYTSKAANTLTMGGGATDYALAKNVSVGDEAYEFPIGSYVDLVCAADEVAYLFAEDEKWTKDRDADGHSIDNVLLLNSEDATTLLHDNVSAEISAITEKTTPVAADMLLLEDSAASNAKKMVQVGNLPGTGVHARAYLSGVQTIATATFTKALLNAEDYDTGNDFDITTNHRFDVPVTGYYLITSQAALSADIADNAQLHVRITLNGSTSIAYSFITHAGTVGFVGYPCATVTHLTAGDYVELYLWHDTGGTETISANSYYTWMSFDLIKT